MRQRLPVLAQLGRAGRGRGRRVIDVKKAAIERSVKSQTVADLKIGAGNGRLHHSATAMQYCPSSSIVARQSYGKLVRRFDRLPGTVRRRVRQVMP
jgi:hypothetical protein